MLKSKTHMFSSRDIMALIAFSIVGSVIYLGSSVGNSFYDAYLEAFNMTNAQFGIVTGTLPTVLNIILYVPSGMLADRFSPKKLLVMSEALAAAVSVYLAFNMSYVSAMIGLLLYTLSGTLLYWSAILKAIRVVGGPEHSGTAYSWYYGASTVICFVVSMLQIWLFDIGAGSVAGIRNAFLVSAVASALSALAVQFMYKESKEAVEAAGSDDSGKITVSDIPHILKNKLFWVASILMLMNWAVHSSCHYFTPYLTEVMGMSVTQGSIFYNVTGYAFYMFCPIAGYLADKVFKSTFKLYIFGFLLWAILLLIIGVVPMGLIGSIVIASTIICFSVCLYGVMWSCLNEIHLPVKYSATAVGLASIIVYASDFFIYTIYGGWIDKFEPHKAYSMIFLTMMGICIAAVLVCIYLVVATSKLTTNKFGEEVDEAAEQ